MNHDRDTREKAALEISAITLGCLLISILILNGMLVYGIVTQGQWFALIAVNLMLIGFAAILAVANALFQASASLFLKTILVPLTALIIVLYLALCGHIVDNGLIGKAQHWLDGYRVGIVRVTDRAGDEVMTYYGDVAYYNRPDGTTVRVVIGPYDPASCKQPEYAEHEHPGCAAKAIMP